MQGFIRTHTPLLRPNSVHLSMAALQSLLLAATLLAATTATAQQFVVAPSATVLSGDPLHISLTGLPVGAVVLSFYLLLIAWSVGHYVSRTR